MKPYYDHAGITIYNCDCLDFNWQIEPFFMCDAIVTSPPYNTLDPSAKPSGLHRERKSGVNEWMQKSGGYFDQMDEVEYQDWQRKCLDVFLGAAACVWINHKVRYRNGFAIHPLQIYGVEPPLFAEVVWDRGISMALNCGRFSPSHEYLMCFGKPNTWDSSLNKLMSVWRIPPSRDSEHPCSFPAEIPKRLIRACVPSNGIVCDPFMGSGTTLRAAKDLGRKAIGIEIEEKYCEIAARRLAQEVLF